MRKILKLSLLAIPLSLAAVPSAHARQPRPEPSPKTAPEIDPNLAIGGLVFLAGSLSVAHARTSKG